MKKYLSPYFFSVLVGAVVVAFLTGWYAFAFTGPSLAPPGCTSGDPGCDAPLHVGPIGQNKQAGLNLGLGLTSAQNGLRIVNGKLLVENGNVGIGTIVPAEVLDVNGNIAVSGNTVIDSNTQFLGRIENRTSDPGGAAVGRIWLRTDL
jgi:hypothetical protein